MPGEKGVQSMPTKLVIVSNREPYFVKRGPGGEVVTQPNAGGLVSALEPLAQRAAATWISWSGFEREMPREGQPLPERVQVPSESAPHYLLRRIPLSEREASLYYYGFASRTLWPLAHQFLGKVEFDPEAWRAYRRVNQRFAEAALEELGDGPGRVWVHDHHLCLVPSLLRAARPELQIGFSWHLPWPPVDVLRALPWARELLEGILGADAIGLSFERDARHFADAVHEIADGTVDEERVHALGREVTLHVQPMGPDIEAHAAWARDARGGRIVRLRRSLAAERLVLAVDPLDFTKGVLERLDAVAHFFDRYPSYRGRVVYC